MEASEERAGDKADHAPKPSGQSASSPGTETRRASSRRASPSRAALTVATDRGKSPPAQDSSTSNGDDSTSPAAHADSASTYGHIAAELYDQLSSAWWAAYEREPSTTMFMTGAAAVFALLLSRMGVLLPLMALALGVVGGYVWAAPEVAPETPSMVGLGKPRALSISIQRLASQFARGRQRRGSKGRSWWRQPVDGGGTGQEQTSSAGGSVAVSPVLQPAGMTYEQAPSTLTISPQVDAVLNPLLELFIRDFVTYWYHPLLMPAPVSSSATAHSEEFQRDVLRAVNAGILNLVEYGQHFTAGGPVGLEMSSLMSYGFANTFIVHLREFRRLEATGLSLDDFLASSSTAVPDTSAMFTAEQLSTDSVRRRLNDLATLFVTRLLPRSDMASKPMRTLVAEMVGSYVLWPLVEYLADPATINELVISNVIPLGAASTRERSRKDRKQRSSSQDAMDGGWEGSELDTQRRRRSTFTAIDVAGLTMKTILQRNDTFSALMEYLESQSAPPYLRFWTNSDIYKQFALLALHEQRSVNAEDRAAVLDTMRTDAMYVFNAHFAAGAELPLYLSIDDDPHATGHDGEGRSIVGALLSEIQTNPNPNCFAACQAFVLRILERRFLAGFKESSMFAQTLRENNQAAAGGLSPLDLQRTMTEETATSVGGASSERGDNAAMEKSPAAVMSTDSDDDDDYEVDPAVYQAFSLGDDDQKGVDETALPSMTSLAESSLHQSSTSSLVIGRDTAMDKAGHTDMALSYGDFDPVAPSISRNLPADADPVLHLAAEITRLREQLLHTTTQIEELRPHTAVETLNLDTQARMRKLNKQRRDTQRQISTLVGMAEELQADESRRASQESLGESGGTSSVGQRQLSGDLATVDLENVSIVVALPKDADERGESRPQTAASSTSTGSNTIMASIGQGLLAGGSMMAALAANANIPGVIPSLTNTVKNMTFDVVLTQTNSALPKSWTLPRSYHAFAMLHKELRLQYAKVDKIAFPSVRKPTREQSSKPREEAKRERLATLVRDMTGYLQLITGDRLLRESRPVVQFFHMDYNGGGSGGGSASKWSSSSSMQEDQWDMESVASSSVRTSLDSMASSLRTPRTPVSPADRPVASPTKPPPYPMRRRASRLSESFEAVATITPATATSTSSSNPNSPSRNLNVATVGDTQDEPEPAPPTMDLPSHFTEADLPLLIDTAFALLADLFDLHHPRHWLRRKALAVLRQFLLQAIATEDKSGKVYEGVMQAVRWWMDVWANPEGGREQSIVDGLKWFRDAYWPGGQWYSVVAAEAAATASPVIAEAGDSAAAKRTATRAKKSRDALISLVIDAPPPSETSPGGSGTSSSSINHTMTAQFYLHRIVGRQNAVQAMHRLWNMTQERRLNRVLVVGMLEVVFKLVFSEDRRKYD